jgi:hypothetical protein
LVPPPPEILREAIASEPISPAPRYRRIETFNRGAVMRGVLLWLVGIPIPVIILLYIFKAM